MTRPLNAEERMDRLESVHAVRNVMNRYEALLGLGYLQEATDLFAFTSRINDRFDMPQKLRMVELMWAVAYADGKKTDPEVFLTSRLALDQYPLIRQIQVAHLQVGIGLFGTQGGHGPVAGETRQLDEILVELGALRSDR